MRARTLNAILTHQGSAAVEAMVSWWESEMPSCEVLVVYGGNRADFEALRASPRVFVEGDGHRTTDHQRQRQSYAGVLAAIAGWLDGRDYEFINLLEFDVIPLSPDWIRDLEGLAESEGAGLLCHHLQRVDGTSDAHFLNHAHDPGFAEHWRSISVRAEGALVMSMIGCHSFWRRDAFEAVAARPEPVPIYLELQLPTLAHHLGYRVRPAPGAAEYMRAQPDFSEAEIAVARSEGIGAVHPVKQMWT